MGTERAMADGKHRAFVLAVLERDLYRCVRCRSRRMLDVHHIVARSAGGTDELGNAATLCRPCHDYVQPRWRKFVDELRARIGVC